MTSDDIKKARLKRGWSQEKMGRKLGLSQSHVASLEIGRRPITKRIEIQLKWICKELRDDERL